MENRISVPWLILAVFVKVKKKKKKKKKKPTNYVNKGQKKE